MSVKTVYLTNDGQVFDRHDDAKAYERGLFDAWLLDLTFICPTRLLEICNNTVSDTWTGTERQVALSFLRAYFNAEVKDEQDSSSTG